MKAFYTNYMQPETASGFQLEQMDRYVGQITATSGIVKVFIKCKPNNDRAALTYEFPENMSEGFLFEIPFNTDEEQTASDLCDAINSENSNSSSPLYQQISGGVTTGGGAFVIESTFSYVTFELTLISGLTMEQTNEPYDMATDDRYVELEAVVRSGDISYLEVGDPVNYLNGLRKTAGQEFEICGRENILRAQVIQITSGSDLNYTVYLKE